MVTLAFLSAVGSAVVSRRLFLLATFGIRNSKSARNFVTLGLKLSCCISVMKNSKGKSGSSKDTDCRMISMSRESNDVESF